MAEGCGYCDNGTVVVKTMEEGVTKQEWCLVCGGPKAMESVAATQRLLDSQMGVLAAIQEGGVLGPRTDDKGGQA